MSEPNLSDLLALQEYVTNEMAGMVHHAITKLQEQGISLDDIDTRTYAYDPGCTYITVEGVHVFRVCAVFFNDGVSIAASWVPEGADALEGTRPDEDDHVVADLDPETAN